MNWTCQISDCFGSIDRKFAGHDMERNNAKNMLSSAIKEGVSYKDYCDSIKNWLSKQLVNSHPKTATDLIENEMKKVEDISTYFDN